MRKTKLNKMQLQVQLNLSLIVGGRLLAIDPSSGSSGSMPGYALYEAGKLVDSGIFKVDLRLSLKERLFDVANTLRREFPPISILVVEYIPPMIFHGRRGSVPTELHNSVGAILSALDVPTVQVASRTWRKHLPPWGYQKTDENDAILLGHAVLWEACKQLGREAPTLVELNGSFTTKGEPNDNVVIRELPKRKATKRRAGKSTKRNRKGVA